AVSAIDAGHVCRQMRWLKHQENSGRLYRVTAALNCYAGDVIIGSLFKFPVYDAAFDGTAPVLSAVPIIPAPWSLQLMPAPDGDGGVHVNAFLPRAAAQKLKLVEWQSYLFKKG
ncbi:MAG: hypothetical protein GY868_15595, partial [Deltaproteobacteria bacterium]|nr:hypothetical protein [Deltaproteobacteria bacterium]